MAAAQLIMFAKAAARFSPVRAGPMQVIRARFHEFVEVRIEILAEHALVMRTRDQMPEMADDVVGKKWLAIFVPVQAPWICGAVRDDFERAASRMIAPDGAIELDALIVGSAGLAD